MFWNHTTQGTALGFFFWLSLLIDAATVLAMTKSRDIQSLGPAADVEEHLRRRPKRHSGADDEQIRRFVIESARLCSDLHCTEVVIFDVRGLNDMCDYILIASGTSDRQIKSVAEDLAELAEEHGHERIGREVDGDAKWVVVDFVDVLAHLFEPKSVFATDR